MLTVSSVAMTSARSRDPLRAKARYYYLEGARRQASGQMAEAYELYKKAYTIDSGYKEAASAYGINRLMVQTDTMQSERELLRSMRMMRPFVEAYPAEEFEARAYAYLASRLDSLSESIRIYERLVEQKPSETFNLLQLADLYMAAKRNEKALETLNRFESIEGKSSQLSLKKMSFMLSSLDTLGAIKEGDELIKWNPREPSFHILKGNLYELLGKNDSTLACYLRAEALNPENGEAKIALAQYYRNIGDSVGYDRKIYETLLSEDFEMEDKLSLLGEYLQTLLNSSGDTSRGDHLFEVIMEQYPHEAQVLDLSARYSAAKGDYAVATEQIEYAIDQNPVNVEYWGQLMRYQLADDKPDDAMLSFSRSGQYLEPTYPLLLMYATAASLEKDYAEAEQAYARLLGQVDSELPLTDSITDNRLRRSLNYDGLAHVSSLYNLLGDMYYQAGEPDKAFRAYDNSLFFLQDNPSTLNNYAYFLTENGGDLDKAYKMSKTAIEREPENPTYLDTFAWVLFKLKDYKEALEYQLKAVAIAEDAGETETAEFYSHLGDILFMNHQPEEAVENWKKALQLEPDNTVLKKKVEHKTFFFE